MNGFSKLPEWADEAYSKAYKRAQLVGGLVGWGLLLGYWGGLEFGLLKIGAPTGGYVLLAMFPLSILAGWLAHKATWNAMASSIRARLDQEG